MGGFSLWHILIFAVIVLLLFGGNRFSNMMGDVAKGLKSFKQGLADDDKPAEPKQIPPQIAFAWSTHSASQPFSQQYESLWQTWNAHGSHVPPSASPSVHTSCVHCVDSVWHEREHPSPLSSLPSS